MISVEKIKPVQDLLRARLGKDYFIYSITTDPAWDNPARLAAFAEENGVKEGWTFLTGTQEVMEGLQRRFFLNPEIHQHQDFQSHHPQGKDCAFTTARYGNTKTGTWGSVLLGSDPKWIVKRLEWVTGNQGSTTPKRRGPAIPTIDTWQ